MENIFLGIMNDAIVTGSSKCSVDAINSGINASQLFSTKKKKKKKKKKAVMHVPRGASHFNLQSENIKKKLRLW